MYPSTLQQHSRPPQQYLESIAQGPMGSQPLSLFSKISEKLSAKPSFRPPIQSFSPLPEAAVAIATSNSGSSDPDVAHSEDSSTGSEADKHTGRHSAAVSPSLSSPQLPELQLSFRLGGTADRSAASAATAMNIKLNRASNAIPLTHSAPSIPPLVLRTSSDSVLPSPLAAPSSTVAAAAAAPAVKSWASNLNSKFAAAGAGPAGSSSLASGSTSSAAAAPITQALRTSSSSVAGAAPLASALNAKFGPASAASAQSSAAAFFSSLNSKFGTAASSSSAAAPSSSSSSSSTTSSAALPSLQAPSLGSTAPGMITPRLLREFDTEVRLMEGDVQAAAGDAVKAKRQKQPSAEPTVVLYNKSRGNQALGLLSAPVAAVLAPLLEIGKVMLIGTIVAVLLDRRATLHARICLTPGIPSGPVQILTEKEYHAWEQLAGFFRMQVTELVNFTYLPGALPAPTLSLASTVVPLSQMKLTKRQKRSLVLSQDAAMKEEAAKRAKAAQPPPPPPVDEDEITEMQLNRLMERLQATAHSEEAEAPPTLVPQLRPYQKQALAWMVARERPLVKKLEAPKVAAPAGKKQKPALPDDWEELYTDEGKIYYMNRVTRSTSWHLPSFPTAPLVELDEPAQVRGGILADDMGMGKTVEILSLILTNTPAAAAAAAPATDAAGPEPTAAAAPAAPSTSDSDDAAMDTTESEPVAKTTLIVCPLSVLTQWHQEIVKHTQPGTLSVYVYHGTNRVRDPEYLAQHDVVLTTFATLATEVPSEKQTKRPAKQDADALLQVHWFRVVLDEAHVIKDRTTRTAKAAAGLKAERRWAVTGTPIQNKLDDIHSLLQFLRVDPCADSGWWQTHIMRPIRNREEKGFLRLQTVLASILLRRTKDQKINDVAIVALPARSCCVKRLQFGEKEEDFYTSLWNSSKSTFESYVATGSVMQNYAHVLELLLRLRQACDHPLLVLNKKRKSPSNVLPIIQRYIAAGSAHPLEQEQAREIMSTWYDEECVLCLEAMEQPVVTVCGHFFCKPCVEGALAQNPECPFCHRALQPATDLIQIPERNQGASTVLELLKSEHESRASTKIGAMMAELGKIAEADASAKTIVFSQWTSMLDLVELHLRTAGVGFVRLDGSMTQALREQAVRSFNTDASIKVFLISMKAGGLGLNLVAACNVMLLDPWWNPAAEEQAIDRVHRLGQTRPVQVMRFVIAGSIEERILELQDKKKMLVQGALGYRSKELRQIRVDELKLLFGSDTTPLHAGPKRQADGAAAGPGSGPFAKARRVDAVAGPLPKQGPTPLQV